MNWRAADKVAAWKVFKRRMEVIFVADQIPEERQWALILVAGGDEAYNRWDVNTMHFKDLSYPQFFRVQECIGPELQLLTSLTQLKFSLN